MWAGYLRPDAAEPFRQGLRYIVKTGDSLFRPESAEEPFDPPSQSQARERLLTGTPTVRAKTLYDIADLKPPPADLFDTVRSFLHDHDTDLQIAAAHALTSFGEAARAAVPELIRCGSSRSELVRIEAAITLAAIGEPHAEVVPELCDYSRIPARKSSTRPSTG